MTAFYEKRVCSFILLILSILITYFTSVPNLPAKAAPKFRLDGEYGLWVEDKNDSIAVHWLTMKPDSGFLKVLYRDKLIYDLTTPESYAHRVVFPAEIRDEIIIKYGGIKNEQDKNETRLFLNYEPCRKCVWENVDSIYVVGDVHGQYDQLTELMKNANVINADFKWQANKSHFVFLGDIFDRGHDVIKTLWFIYQLEHEAKRQGGHIHFLFGNHELLVLQNDLRYTSGKERLVAQYHQTTYPNLFNLKESVLGKWMGSKIGILKIDDILFAHGGITPEYAKNYSIESFNDSLFQFLHEKEFAFLQSDSVTTVRGKKQLFDQRYNFFLNKHSVFWNREYVLKNNLKKKLNFVLEMYDAKLMIVGHSAVPTIKIGYDEKLLAVDIMNPVTEMLFLLRQPDGKLKKFRYTINGEREKLPRYYLTP